MTSPRNRPPGGQMQPRPAVGYVGISLAAVGAMFLITGATSLNWYHLGYQDHPTLSDLQAGAEDMNVGLMSAYGGFLVWILVILVVGAAVVACIPMGSAGPAMRVAAPIAAILGIALTFSALSSYWSRYRGLNRTDDVPDGKVGIFTHSTSGLYLTLAGFLIAGIAGVFGPRRA